MAIVADKSTGIVNDKSFVSYNRVSAGEPNASLTPQYAGEIVLDTTNNCIWKALGITNTTWIALTAPN